MHRKKIMGFAFLVIALALAVFLPFQITKADSTYYWKWPATRTWKLQSYNTYVKFSSPLYCDRIGYDRFPDNSRWYYYNPRMGEGVFSGWWWISAQNGDVTITRFFESSRFEANLAGSSVTLKMSCPEPSTVEGITSYSWTNNILTATGSSAHLIVDFTPITPQNPYLTDMAVSAYLGGAGLATMLLPIIFMCYALPRGRVSGSNCIALGFVAFVGFALLMAAVEM